LTIIFSWVIISAMIKDFKCKETKSIFNGLFSKKLPQEIQRLAERKLIMLHRAGKINDLRVPPANRLETLSGNRKGQHSIHINKKWRICFEWKEDGVHGVEIVDYQ